MRKKLEIGKIYMFKSFDVGRDISPTLHYTCYVCLVREIKGHLVFVKVLACEPSSADIKIGIGDVYKTYSYVSYTSEDTPHPEDKFYRELIIGECKDDDCLSWTSFDVEDVPLCLGWGYVGDEIKEMLR
jgi:hypothetical protein